MSGKEWCLDRQSLWSAQMRDYIKAERILVLVCLTVCHSDCGSCRVINLNDHSGISSQPVILQLDNRNNPQFILELLWTVTISSSFPLLCLLSPSTCFQTPAHYGVYIYPHPREFEGHYAGLHRCFMCTFIKRRHVLSQRNPRILCLCNNCLQWTRLLLFGDDVRPNISTSQPKWSNYLRVARIQAISEIH